jgi:hypothetical protein
MAIFRENGLSLIGPCPASAAIRTSRIASFGGVKKPLQIRGAGRKCRKFRNKFRAGRGAESKSESKCSKLFYPN